jgi:hypothetical protein
LSRPKVLVGAESDAMIAEEAHIECSVKLLWNVSDIFESAVRVALSQGKHKHKQNQNRNGMKIQKNKRKHTGNIRLVFVGDKITPDFPNHFARPFSNIVIA